MAYDIFEHRHRFAIWAAARAAQRGYTSIPVLRAALEAGDIATFLRDPASLETDRLTFDGLHRLWCGSIYAFLVEQAIPRTTFGRAAKLVAVYLKSMVVIGPHGASALAAVVHPPIDRLLLQNLALAKGAAFPHASWRRTAWTSLNEHEYYQLISEVRDVLSHGEPLWKLEQYWTVTSARPARSSDLDAETVSWEA